MLLKNLDISNKIKLSCQGFLFETRAPIQSVSDRLAVLNKAA
jgi:hypothetical protein